MQINASEAARSPVSANEGDALALTFTQPVVKKVRHRAGTGVKAVVDYDVYG